MESTATTLYSHATKLNGFPSKKLKSKIIFYIPHACVQASLLMENKHYYRISLERVPTNLTHGLSYISLFH